MIMSAVGLVPSDDTLIETMTGFENVDRARKLRFLSSWFRRTVFYTDSPPTSLAPANAELVIYDKFELCALKHYRVKHKM